MIVDPNISGYIRSLEPDLPEYLDRIEKYGRDHAVPLLRKEEQSLLRYVIKGLKPKKILEIGTAIGFSALFMAQNAEGLESLDSIEKDIERYNLADENIKKTNFCDIIHLFAGDAAEVLDELLQKGNKYDLVFLDAAKAQYGIYYPMIREMLNNGGVLLTDNVLQEGSVASSKFSVTRRNRTIHIRMREFIETVMSDKMFESVIIPLGDGMLCSRKVN